MDTKVNDSTMAAFRERVARRVAAGEQSTKSLKTGVVRGKLAPITGNVHIPTGRVANREAVSERFRKLKF